MKTLIPILWGVFLCTTLFAQSEICDIDLLNGTRVASFANGESVEISFEYSTDRADGVRIFARPFTNGSLTSGYGASGSPIYTGMGTGTANFTISSGAVTVDEIRFQILNPDQSELLKEFWIPVEYHFGEVGVHDFTFSADQNLGSFLLGEQVEIGFAYDASSIGAGVRIFVRPITNGSLTPDYGASGSPIFTGTGSSLAGFTINSGTNVRVDALRVTVTNSDQSATLQTFFIPVNWYWSTVKVTDFSYGANNFFANGDNFNISYDYETTETGGVRIFPRPISNTGLTPDYGACGSSVYTGSGTASCNITITEGNQRVDHIRFSAVDPDQNTLLELFLPVDLYFGRFSVANLQSCPPSPARLMPDEDVRFYFDLTNQESSAARAFVRPFTEGSPSTGYAASGSPSYPVGTTASSALYTLKVPGLVEQSRFSITNEDQSQDWAAFFYAVDYNFGSSSVTSVAPSLAATQFLSWQLAPNPVREKAIFSVSVLESHRFQIRLVDYQGRILKTLDQRTALAGDQLNFDLDVKAWNLSSGIYFLQVQAENYSVVEPLVVQQ